MSDLIRREDALHAIGAEIVGVTSEGRQLLDMCQFVIKQIPSAEPEDRTAKVKHKSDTYVVTPPKSTTTSYETRTNLWEECGNCHAMGMYHGWNYCPKCGVKLDWSENE